MPYFGNLRVANQARQQEWDPDKKLDTSFRVIELIGEVGEAMNVYKKLKREILDLPGSRAQLTDLLDEIADVVIVADLLFMDLDIDIDTVDTVRTLLKRWGFDFDLDRAVRHKFNVVSTKLGLKTLMAVVK